MKWTLSWSRATDGAEPVPQFDLTVSSVQELDRELDRITELARGTDPLMVDLYDDDDPDGAVLGIGLGADRSVASWTLPNDEPGSMGSRGDGTGRSTDDEPWFVWSGEASYFDPATTISVDAARQAMREYMRTGARPTNIEWEPV